MKVILTSLFLLSSCSLPWSKPSAPSAPSLPGLPGGAGSGSGAAGSGAAADWTAIATQWWWMSLLLLLFFPQLRTPIASFWRSVFAALSIPFLWVQDWWESKRKGGSK